MTETLLTRIRGAGGKLGPSEAPDTLQSDSIASILILLGEGECAGLANGLQDVFFSFSGRASDAVPVQNADGSYNFNGVIAVFTPGTPDQDPLPGFPAVETTVTDGAQIFHSTPLVREITDPDADAVIVTIEVPALYSTDPNTGNVNDNSVGIQIEVQANGGSYTTALATSISGKSSSSYQKSYRIPLTGSAPWNVRVSRTSADPVSVNNQNYTYLSSYTIVQDFQLIYPDSCLLGLTVDARLFGTQIPTVLCKLQGLTWQIPTNYDPVARTYATSGPGTTGGVWDGSFVTAWTNNPAWIFYGLVTNPRFGLGQFVDATLIDKFSLYAIGQYCDGLVPDGTGSGSTEPRYVFNGVISSQADAIKALQVIASCFRGMVFWGSLGVMVAADMPADPVKLIVPGNTIQGEITYSGTGQKAIHTVCLVTWCNPDLNYEKDILVVETPNLDDIARYGWRPINLTAAGCTSRGQAYRMGLWLLYVERREGETANFTASWDQADLAPGDIVSVADPAYAGARFGGRLLGTTVADGVVTAITLDAPVALESGQSYTFLVMLPDGTVGESAITTGAGTTSTLSLATPLTQTPVSGAIWQINSTEVEPRQFRCIVNKENSKHLFDITALLHDPGLYDLIEQDVTLEPATYTLLPSGGLAAPTGLTVLEGAAAVSGVSTQNTLTVFSWSVAPDPRIKQFEAQVQIGGTWQPSVFVTGQSVDFQGLAQRTYAFRVRSLGAGGAGSTTLTSAWAEIDGISLTPPTVYVAPGAVTVDSLVAGLSDFVTRKLGTIVDNINETAGIIASAAQEQDAQNWLDKYTLATAAYDNNAVITANVTENATAIADASGAFAAFETTVDADIGGLDSSVTTNSTAIATIDGKLAGQWTVMLDVNGYVSGVEAYNDGSTADFIIIADNFEVAQPGVSGGSPVAVFAISDVSGTSTLTLAGNMFADGIIEGRSLTAGSVNADNAAIGTAAVGTLEIAGNAVTVPVYANINGAPYLYGTGSYENPLNPSCTFTAPAGNTVNVIIIAVFSQGFASETTPYAVQLKANSGSGYSTIASASGNGGESILTLIGVVSVAATGSPQTVSAQLWWEGSSGNNELNAAQCIMMSVAR